jgi:hypothetical protein
MHLTMVSFSFCCNWSHSASTGSHAHKAPEHAPFKNKELTPHHHLCSNSRSGQHGAATGLLLAGQRQASRTPHDMHPSKWQAGRGPLIATSATCSSHNHSGWALAAPSPTRGNVMQESVHPDQPARGCRGIRHPGYVYTQCTSTHANMHTASCPPMHRENGEMETLHSALLDSPVWAKKQREDCCSGRSHNKSSKRCTAAMPWSVTSARSQPPVKPTLNQVGMQQVPLGLHQQESIAVPCLSAACVPAALNA